MPAHCAESRVHTLDACMLFLLCVYMHAHMHSRVPSPFAKTTSGVQFFLRAGVLIMEDCGVGEGFQVTSWHCKEVAHTQSLRFGLFLPRAWDGMRARSTNIYHRSTSAAHGRGGPPNPGCWSCPGFCINTRDHTTHGHNFRARNKEPRSRMQQKIHGVRSAATKHHERICAKTSNSYSLICAQTSNSYSRICA